MLIKERLSGFRNRVLRSASGLWFPDFDLMVPKRRNVLGVLRSDGERLPLMIPASNIVTNAGDIYYAQRSCGETPTNAFGILELASAGTPGKAADRDDFTPIGSTQKAHDATYPQTDDEDADNTGAGTDIVTYLTSYAKGDFNAASITHGFITNTGAGAGAPLLTGFAFASGFAKTANDTLKVFTNHTMNGV
mgnify:CR=1 FL=1